MHDINKELEKFFQLLEEAESSSENETGSPTSNVPQATEPDRKPVPLQSTPPQNRTEGGRPTSSSAPASETENRIPQTRATNPPTPVSRITPPTRQYVEPTPLDSLPPRPARRPPAAPVARTSSSTPDDTRSAASPKAPPSRPNYQVKPIVGQSRSGVPNTNVPTPSGNGQSNLDQLMQEVRGKLNQPARPRSTAIGSTMPTRQVDRNLGTIVVDAPASTVTAKVPTWRKGVLTGLAMVLPACLALAIILNRPDPTIEVDTSTAQNANALPAEQAELSMTSTPSGARIFLNGELFGVTPFESIRIRPGEYQVTAEVPGYASIDTVLTLRARHWVSLNIPNGEDDVFLAGNGESQDHILAGLPSSNSNDSNDEAVEETPVESQPTQQRQQERTPPRQATRPRPTKGSIMFTSEPSGASVFLDNELKGVTPLSLGEVNGGSHSVKYALEGYDDYSVAFELTPGIQTPLHGTLNAAFGTLVLDITSTGTVFIDGSLVESDVVGARSFQLEAGPHKIAVQRSGMVPWEMDITVNPGQAQTVAVQGPASGFSNAYAEAEGLYGRGEYQAARDAFESALALDPSNRLVTGKIAEIDRLLEAELTQERTEAIIENGVYLITDTPPKLVGGLEGLHRKVKYPEAAYQAGVTGRVYIQFVVNEDGTASNFTVTKGLPLGCNEEAIRAIEAATFEPATFDGRTVKARHTLFVNFGQ